MREGRFGFILWLVFFICYHHSHCSAEEDAKNRQTFVIRYKDGDQTIPVTVVLDYKKQTEYVINMNPRTPAKSVTLYDFKQRTIAYKDLTNKECFLGRLTHETLSEESIALQDVKNPVEVRPKMRSLDPKMPALTPTEIRNLAGQKTAVFCRKMNTWLLMPEKSHGISKREADEEFEERSLHYHGHRSSQYSHFERESRRRFRNRNSQNHRRRSRTRETAAIDDNDSSEDSEPSASPYHSGRRSFTTANIDGGSSDKSTDAREKNHSHNHETSQSHSSFIQKNEEGENVNDKDISKVPTSDSNIGRNDFGYTRLKNRYPSPNLVYPRPHYFSSNDTDGTSLSDHVLISDPSKVSSENFKESAPLARLLDEDNDEGKITTTESPSVLYRPGVSYPNVHSSLAHLLPLYKPLGQEFDFDQETRSQDQSNNLQPSNRRDIESEAHPSSTTMIKPYHALIQPEDLHNTSHDPDVSVNVLEVPKITKEFENIRNIGSFDPVTLSGSDRKFHRSKSSHPFLAQTHPEQNSNVHARYIANKASDEETIDENRLHAPHLEVSSTTGLPFLTTRQYFASERTTPDSLYIPSVHTAFQNLEDFNSFQIFPNYIENDGFPSSSKSNSSVDSFHDQKYKIRDFNTGDIPQDLVLTTEQPLIEKHAVDSSSRSDTPSEDNNGKSSSFSRAENGARRNFYPLNIGDDAVEDFSPQKIRYQNVFRDFKPDEIIIDIENIPTHTPPPVTASFRRRIATTVPPSARTLSTESSRSNTTRRSEQVFGTTWRSVIPTTRFPRRKLTDKSRRPIQTSSISLSHRAPPNQNRHKLPSSRVNQLFGVNHFNPGHHSNRRQFHYPNRQIPPSPVNMRADINQLHHISHLNNLPPGVSMHPRHPQAPFADMVHSNRPPTIPVLTDNQEYLKPHRQRHHRKKDRSSNSCCRLRGKSGAFQACCRNGGPCCRSHQRIQPPGNSCCSSSKVHGQIIPTNQIQPPVRTANKILPPIRTEETHRSEVDNNDRCQKEKMCRTLYESTQQVMVCRNAHVEGC